MTRAFGDSPRIATKISVPSTPGEAEVHQRDVWAMAAKFGDCFNAIGGLRHKNQIGFSLDYRGETLTKDRMIIDTQDANRLAEGHAGSPRLGLLVIS